MSKRLKIAVLGTGMMGLPMARRLAQAGHEVHAWNRTRAKAEPLAADGVTIHDNAADAVQNVDFAVSLLESGAIVGEVLFNLGVAEAMWGGYISTGLVDIIGFIIVILTLIFRPYGILGKPRPQKV